MKKIHLGIAAALLTSLISVGGCSASPSASDDVVSLLDTKQAAQLLRNKVTGQVSSDSTEEITQIDDASVSCDGDSSGLMRQWRSTALTELVADRASDVTRIAQTISGSFVVKGWSSEADQLSESSNIVTLVNPDYLATISITATEDTDGDGRGATILVEVTGLCVLTDGPDSEELALLGE